MGGDRTSVPDRWMCSQSSEVGDKGGCRALCLQTSSHTGLLTHEEKVKNSVC